MNHSDNLSLVVQETVVLRKFGPEWTEEQIASGEAQPFEVVTTTDGVITDIWRRDA